MHLAWMLAGATATGKTAVAQLLAEQLGCSVLSADAMLVYRGMEIGTAKPSGPERGSVPYFGIDLVTPAEPFSTGAWLSAARQAIDSRDMGVSPVCPAACGMGVSPMSPASRGMGVSPMSPASRGMGVSPMSPSSRGMGVSPMSPASRGMGVSPMSPSLIVAGGTGLYLKALTDGLDSDASDPACRARWQSLFEREGPAALQRALAERAPGALETLVAPSNPRRLIRALEHLETRGCLPQQWKRTPPAAPVTVLRLPREQLHARIARRVAAMFGQGLVDEVRALRQTYPVWSPTAAAAIGYAEAGAVLDGTLTLREAAERIVIRTRQLAKRQETWFRHQTQAVWLEIDDNDPPERVARRVLDTWRQHGPTPLVRP